MINLEETVLSIMAKRTYQPSTINDLLGLLSIEGLSFTEFKEILKKLERQGKVRRLKGGKYVLHQRREEIVGRIQVNKKGYGVVRVGGKGIYVRWSNLAGAMHNDLVMVKVSRGRRRGGLRGGKVVRILERAHRRVVGRFNKKGKRVWVAPSDRRLLYDVTISSKNYLGAKRGDMVVAEITRYPDGHLLPQGKIIEVLGDETHPAIEIEVLIREHTLPVDFPQDVLEEAEKIPERVDLQELSGRKDYRSEFTVTIDGLDAKDFDDAVSISRVDEGYCLKVHIADVSYYVSPGSALDREALERGFSTYLVDRVLPMLPRKLSNEICSLNPDVDRLSLSVEMLVDSQGEVRRFDIREGVIRSNFRLTYEQVDEELSSGKFSNKSVEQQLKDLRELSDILEGKRVKRGSLNFETIEPKVILDDQARPVEVVIRERTPATKLIEEAMIVTNETVANFMRRRKLPMVYRVHEEPDLEAIFEIGEIVKQLGYPAKAITSADPKAIQNIIKFAHMRPERLLINNLLLRAMKQARYASELHPHFGLASDCYTHFTSPIRRYPDLIVHRIVKAALYSQEKTPMVREIREKLTDICDYVSLREREIEEAERESVNIKLCELMKDYVGEVFEGIITGVQRYGFFVQIPNSAEGLVHCGNLYDDYYQFEPQHFLLRGRRTGKVYRLGQRLKVKLTNVIVGERILDFIPVEEK